MREEKEKRNHKLTRHDKDGALQGSLVAWSRRVSSVDQRWLCCTHGVPLQLQRWDPILCNPFLKKPKHLPLKKPHQFIKKMYYFELFPPTMCSSSSVCVRGEALLTGWNLDGQRLHAMHLSAPCWGRLLWDVSTQTDGVIWCPDANSF